MAGSARGVYFLADDRIGELAIAFLNSFRAYNPDLPLCLVPCHDRIDRLLALRDEYCFTVFEETDLLRRCDRIGGLFHGRILGQYRKLAMWEGGFEEFLYIDADTVVLDGVGFVFKHLADHDFVASHSDLYSLRRFVWKRSIFGAGILDRRQILFAANTGFLASRRGALSVGVAEAKAAGALRLAPHMALSCVEQPFLNYLIVTSGGRYTSLRVLEKRGPDPEMRAERWAGERWGVVRNGRLRFPDRRPPALLLHWAGRWQPTLLGRWLAGLRVRLGLAPDPARTPRRLLMPYRRLWNHYRHLREGGAS